MIEGTRFLGLFTNSVSNRILELLKDYKWNNKTELLMSLVGIALTNCRLS